MEVTTRATNHKLLVFIPCYNCEQQIGRVLEQFRDVPPEIFDEILVLDNRSSDGTVGVSLAAIARLRGYRFTVARNRENYNLGGSHKAVFGYAEERGFSHVIVLHGDDQGRIADVLPLLASGAHRDHDACLGSRFMAGSRIEGYAVVRRIGNRVFNLVFSLALRRRVTDLGSGLNVFGRSVFPREITMHLPDDLYFNPYLLAAMVDRGLRIRFFPISWREDDQVSNVHMASQALRTLNAAREFVTNRAALRAGEHRKVVRAEYTFDVLAHVEPVPSELQAP
jgi:glycosyltransferase involved in cell wall biosynthesis